MGTPNFAVQTLEELVNENYNIVGVFTKPDKPVGRKKILKFSPVKQKALEYGIDIYQPAKFDEEYVNLIKNLNLDACVVAAYGVILPSSVLNAPKYGSFNVHASLLPKYRGAAPIQASIMNCDSVTGVTIMYMAEKLDSGDILKKVQTKIGLNETADELSQRLSKIGAKAMCEVLKDVELGVAERIPQNEQDASYVFKITKDMARLNFNRPAMEVHKLICGLSSWPCAYCYLNGKMLKIYKSAFMREFSGNVGEVLCSNRFVVGCKDFAVEFLDVQLEGRKRMIVKDFLNGFKLEKGICLQ